MGAKTKVLRLYFCLVYIININSTHLNYISKNLLFWIKLIIAQYYKFNLKNQIFNAELFFYLFKFIKHIYVVDSNVTLLLLFFSRKKITNIHCLFRIL